MNYGPSSPLYLARKVQTDMLATEKALLAILEGTEVNWLHSHGPKVFKINLSGVCGERDIPNYLKVRK